MFHQFVDAISGSWAYPAIFLVSLLDAFFPLVPSETVVITAGVLAASGKLNLGAVIALAAIGAFIGDQISYAIGRYLGHRVVARFMRGPKGQAQLAWAEEQLAERGPYLILIGRFIPGGRTAVTFTCGMLEWRWARFVVFDAIAATLWAVYAAMLGYVGGAAFEKQPWKGLLLAFAAAALIGGFVELVRHRRDRRKKKAAMEALDEDAA